MNILDILKKNKIKRTIMKEKIIKILYSSIDEINKLYSENKKMEKSTKTVLFGSSGSLDSLGLVNFIVSTEEKIQDEFDVLISLADERAMSKSETPFRTVGSLINYIEMLLLEEING